MPAKGFRVSVLQNRMFQVFFSAEAVYVIVPRGCGKGVSQRAVLVVVHVAISEAAADVQAFSSAQVAVITPVERGHQIVLVRLELLVRRAEGVRGGVHAAGGNVRQCGGNPGRQGDRAIMVCSVQAERF